MASIFLSGGGYANKTKKLDDIFRNSVRNPERMLFIPVAMPPEIFSFGECYDWICSVFPEIGFSRIDMWTNLRNRVIADVRKYSAIYFGGGNTFSLLHEIQKCGFDKLIFEYISRGGLVYGGSAGAIILGKDIRTAAFGGDADINKVRIKKFKGLDLLKGISIQCHYTKIDDVEIFDFVNKHGTNIVALPDETGIYSAKGKWSVAGDKSAFLFTKEHKIELKHGSKLSF